MNISFIEIQNFRKLKACRVEIASQETILVGANNSGKTSAIDAMILFLKKGRRKDIVTTDFTLSNWPHINRIGAQWARSADEDHKPDLTLQQWLPYLPALDVWLHVDEADIHHVIHLLPTLDWTPNQLLGIRLVLVPTKKGAKSNDKTGIEGLYKNFRDAYASARDTEPTASSEDKRRLSLWPNSMREFLDRELHRYFAVRTRAETSGSSARQSMDGECEVREGSTARSSCDLPGE